MFWRGVLGYLPMNLVQGLVGLASIALFTRMLTPADYGAYALAFSAMSLAHTLTFTWIEAAMARFHAAETESGGLADLFATLYRLWAVLALGFVAAAGLVMALWPGEGPVKLAIGAGLAAILARSLVKLVQERRRAAGDVRGAAGLDICLTLGAFVLGVGLILAGWRGAAPLAGAGAAAAIAMIFILPGELRRGDGGRFSPARARSYAIYGAPVALSLILALALATTDRFLLAWYLGEGAVGVYHAGYSLANRTLDVMFIWLGAAGGPALIVALERGGAVALAKAAREQASLMIALALPACVGLALVAHPLAEVMVGPSLRDGAAQVTPWIAVSALFAGLTTYYSHQAFTLGRRTDLLLAAMSLPALANLALNLVLIPRFGLQGALWATTASYGLGLGASLVLGRRAQPLPLPLGELARAGAASLVMGATVAALPSLGGVAELALKAGVGALVYAGAAFALDVGALRSRAGGVALLLRQRMAA
ncbi:MAG TPA: lipopolysaccharide biosynthesis protein [Caulobacteraceae bacterium]|nr:lipopolysaccharide biosynthesis protein [Caulobacteraceae bacterium]